MIEPTWPTAGRMYDDMRAQIETQAARITELEEVVEAAIRANTGLWAVWKGVICRDLDERLMAFNSAPAALEARDE